MIAGMGFGRKTDMGNSLEQVNVCTKAVETKRNKHEAFIENTNSLHHLKSLLLTH